MSINLYHKVSVKCNAHITKEYSTSFSYGIRLLGRKYQEAIYSIYGYVRVADEIVDSFHGHEQAVLFDDFEKETWIAFERGISTNPVINAFLQTYNQFNIDKALLEAFLKSMRMDLTEKRYDEPLLEDYIYGSAEVVGLMCLKVFCDGNEEMYRRLKSPARSLGAAFQKVNFLRDIKDDLDDKGRIYFPHLDFTNFSVEAKEQIEMDIQKDFDEALVGIRQLPDGSRIGVYLAYKYYIKLFRKIRKKNPDQVLHKRTRINNAFKLLILTNSMARYKLNLL